MINPPHDRKIEGQIKNTGAPEKPLSKKEGFLSLCSYSLYNVVSARVCLCSLSLSGFRTVSLATLALI